jgi:lipid-binding SYLF domain-containing protein
VSIACGDGPTTLGDRGAGEGFASAATEQVMKNWLSRVSSVILSAMVVAATGCSTAPKSEAARAEIQDEAATALATAQKNDPSLTPVLNSAAGYAVFPTVGKGAIGVGGAYGRGVLYEGGVVVGYCDLTQGSIGLQLGGQTYTEIIVFETKAAVDKFKAGGLAFAAQATAVALKSGAGANAKYADGVAVFTMGESGLMYEASIGGQSFSYQPK